MTLSTLFAIGALLLGIAAIGVGITAIIAPRHPVVQTVSTHASIAGVLIVVFALITSLYYSEVKGYPPCDLCLIQRAFIYPQILLFLAYLYIRERLLLWTSLILSLVGLVIAAYHVYIDIGGAQFIACGAEVSCTQRFVFEFGFVTIPLMSLIGFFSLLVITAIALAYAHKKDQ